MLCTITAKHLLLVLTFLLVQRQLTQPTGNKLLRKVQTVLTALMVLQAHKALKVTKASKVTKAHRVSKVLQAQQVRQVL